MSGLRVALVVGTGQFAGTERYVTDVAGELARRGHRVVVVGGEPAAMRALLPGAVRHLPGATPAAALRSLAAAGRQDVVHSHTPKADYEALLAAPATGGRRVSTRHIAARRGHGALARRAAPLVQGALARELVVSRYLASQVDTAPDAVVLNGVADAEGSAPGQRPPVVLVAQRLAPEKDTATALRAWAASGLGGAGWQLRVAGDGPERPALERLAAELGVGASVRFLGWVADASAEHLRAAVLLAPAPGEPCGLSVLEAMARAVPVVAAGAAGHLETVGRDPAAALFAPGDAARAAELLRDLATDGAARAAYGARLQALQRAQLGLAAHVARLEEEYAAALAPGAVLARRQRAAARLRAAAPEPAPALRGIGAGRG